MQQFEYRAIPAPARAAKVKGIKDPTERHAHTLSELMNEMAAEGWEYMRADVLPCTERKGLTGSVTVYNTMLVFRRPTADALAAAMTMGQPLAAHPIVAPQPVAPVVTEPQPVAPRIAAPAPMPHATTPAPAPAEALPEPQAAETPAAADPVPEAPEPAEPEHATSATAASEHHEATPVLPLSARVSEGAAPPLVLRRDNDVPATAPTPQKGAAPGSQTTRRPGWPFTH